MGGGASPSRVVAGIASGGQSELARAVSKAVGGGTTGTALSTALLPAGGLANIGSKALFPEIPKPNLGTVDTAAQEEAARNAVQSQEAEARRQRAAKRISSVLTGGLGLPGSAPTASATLQPTEARKSVLG